MKYQSYIRSLFVAFAMCLVGIPAMAEETATTAENAVVHLNPFAYRLDDMTAKSGANLSNDYFEVKYSLSGPATSVVIRLWDITNDATKSTWSRDGGNTGTCLTEFPLTGSYLQKGAHTYRIDFTDVIGQGTSLHGKKVRWTVDVVGGNTKTEYSSKNVTVTNITQVKAGSTSRGTGSGDELKTSLATEMAKDQLTKQTETKTYKFINADLVTNYIGFRYPGGVDICNDPYNYNFGAVFCVESYRKSDVSSDTYGGPSQGLSPGMYVFGAGMELLQSHYGENSYNLYSGPGWDHANGMFGSYKAVAPGRVRITDDNRIFISALSNAVNSENRILYEVTAPLTKTATSSNNFYECPTTGGKWRAVFTGGNWATDGSSTSQYQTTGSAYIASPSMALDVRGSDASLQLLTLSAELGAINQSTREYYHIDKYDLKTATTWSNQAPTSSTLPNNGKVTVRVHHDAISSLVGRDATGIEYDPQGGYWISQYRANPAGALAITLLHVTKNGEIDYEEHAMNRNKGAVRHNHNNTKLIVSGGILTDTIMHKLNATGTNLDDKYYAKATIGTTYTFSTLQNSAKNSTSNQDPYNGSRFFANQVANRKQFTMYSVSYDNNGKATLSDSMYIDIGALGETGVRDFAFDFANNLYVASYDKHRLCAFALPNGGKTVSTPCKTDYNFTLSPVYAFNVAVNPTVSGADTYASIVHERIGKAPYPNYLHNALMNLRADVLTGCKFYKWTGQTGTHTTDGNKLVINNLASAQNITAQIGICAYDDTDILAVKKETTFPAAFVKRDMDNVSYSTICFPFDIATLTDELAGASVLKFTGTTIEKVENGCTHLKLQFEEVTFTGDDIIKAGIPYLIQPKNNITGEFTINRTVTCPANLDENGYGGKSVTYNGVTFHGLVNGATFTPDENRLFLVANDRLANLTSTGSINGLRAFFTVSVPSPVICEISLPNKSATSVPEVTTPQDGNVQPTKYMQDGQMFIQQGGQVFNATGAHVK
ncbi:MAG: hypothetical protein II248_01055 [Paludibacteraceae bacterium]|nr:hypothetical protein [Paludibacteraceae bacterium]